MNWWSYYKLRNEPHLYPDALISQCDLELFYGREKDIETVTVLTQGSSKTTLLLTGNPGVGKTSLVHKLFGNEKDCYQILARQQEEIFKHPLCRAESAGREHLFTRKQWRQFAALKLEI